MYATHRYVLSVLTAGLVAAAAQAQAPADEGGQQPNLDPDEIAVEEFVRELRESAEADHDDPSSGGEVTCTEPCTTIGELLALIRNGPSSIEPESDIDDADLSDERAEGDSQSEV